MKRHNELQPGVRIGKLTLVERVAGSGGRWLCVCDCGGEAIRSGASLFEAMTAGREIGCRSCAKCGRPPGSSSNEFAISPAFLTKPEGGRFGSGCRFCADQSWRRNPNGCLGCDKPYEPEPLIERPLLQSSSMGLFVTEE
jgi:hypothetical protein